MTPPDSQSALAACEGTARLIELTSESRLSRAERNAKSDILSEACPRKSVRRDDAGTNRK